MSAAWFQQETKAVATGSVPGPRAAHSANVIGNKLLVFGGWNGAPKGNPRLPPAQRRTYVVT
jgi:hypothetical protein